MASNSLEGKVALVTGASRGLGKGIALELGSHAATVYITGRPTVVEKQAEKQENTVETSTLEEVAEEITKRGGKGIPVYCDHSNPDEIKALFERIGKEQSGLDVLVNNAFAGAYHMLKTMGKKFYEHDESPEASFDILNNVGLRNNYICSVYAARMMVKRQSGCIINISSIGGLNYLFSIPYGVGKEALIRMSADMAIELSDKGVQSLAILPGGVKTEIVSATIMQGPDGPAKQYFDAGETIYYPGRVIAFLASKPELLKKYNGKAVTTTEIGDEYGITDVAGNKPRDPRIDQYKQFLADLNKVHLESLPK